MAYNVDLHCLSVLTEKPVMKPSLAAAHRAIVSLVADAHLRSSVQPSGADQGANVAAEAACVGGRCSTAVKGVAPGDRSGRPDDRHLLDSHQVIVQ